MFHIYCPYNSALYNILSMVFNCTYIYYYVICSVLHLLLEQPYDSLSMDMGIPMECNPFVFNAKTQKKNDIGDNLQVQTFNCTRVDKFNSCCFIDVYKWFWIFIVCSRGVVFTTMVLPSITMQWSFLLFVSCNFTGSRFTVPWRRSVVAGCLIGILIMVYYNPYITG